MFKGEVILKFVYLFLVVIFTSCSSYNPEEAKLHLRILHTNDHHGHYLKDRDGQYGMAARKTLIDKMRKSSRDNATLLLSGGDINTGTMESDIFDAKPDFLGMKKIGYDAMAIGNHEFDNDFKVLLKQKKWAGFPFLSANIFYKDSGKRVFEPAYIIKEFKGVKVGIFGLTTIDTPFKASSDDAKKKFIFKPIIDAAKPIVEELKLKADIIIAVTHIGHYGSATSKGDVELAKAVDGIDVIVGGHSQEIINAEVHNDTIIVQAEDWGKYLGVLDLYIGEENLVDHHDYVLNPINLKKRVGDKKVLIAAEIKENSEMIQLFRPFREKAEKIGKKTVGTLNKTLSAIRGEVRSKQMPIGQFVGETIAHKISTVDAVVLNGGSIRAGLEKGKISRKDLHNVHPYGNTIATVTFNKEQFFNYVDEVSKFSIVDPKNLIGGYPQISLIKIFMKDGKLVRIEDEKGHWSLEKKEGKIHSKKEFFTIGTMNFLAKGGDNYPVIIHEKSYIDTGFMINSAMMEYAIKKKTIDTKKFEQRAPRVINVLNTY